MLKPHSRAILLTACLVIWFTGKTSAQVNLSLADIKKILITNTVSGMRGGTTLSMVVKPEKGKWNSYQTSEYVRMIDSNLPNSFKPIKIAIVPNDIMTSFITGLRTIKPKFDPNTFGVTPAILKVGLQIKKRLLSRVPDFDSLITTKTIATAIDKAFHRDVLMYDYGVDYSINILKTNGDTVKIETGSYGIGLLPWVLNKQETFDMNITHFFEESMGEKSFGGKYDPIEVTWAALGQSNPQLLHYRWNYGYPDNMALLKHNYDIKTVNIGDAELPPFVSKDLISCTFTCRELGPNIILAENDIDISNLTCLKKLNSLKNKINQFKTANHFFFKYYNSITDAKIHLSKLDESNHLNGGFFMDLYQQIPEAEQYYRNQYIDIYVNTPNGSGNWAMMPDGRIILLSISKDAKPESLPLEVQKTIDIKKVGQKSTYAFFSARGKRLR